MRNLAFVKNLTLASDVKLGPIATASSRGHRSSCLVHPWPQLQA